MKIKSFDKGKPMITAIDIAQYVIKTFHERGDLITNLKLQKLLYYVEGWYLGLNNQRIFEEDFEAWVHGPVLPSVYQKYKKYKWNPISEDINPTNEIYESMQKHVDKILDVYGMDTAWELERRTHLEDPWKFARGNIPSDEESETIITKASMQSFFSKLRFENIVLGFKDILNDIEKIYSDFPYFKLKEVLSKITSIVSDNS